MAINIGSMLVKAKFEGGNLISGLSTMNDRFKESQLASKNANQELVRMQGSLVALGTAAYLTSGSLLRMLMNAIMQSPFLAAALAKLKTQMMLFGNAIARHLAPILEKVVNFVKWLREKFEALPEPIQSALVKFVAIGIIILGLITTFGFLGIALAGIKTGLATMGLASAATKFAALKAVLLGTTASSLFFGIALGLISGALIVLALDKYGVLDWFGDLGQKIRDVSGYAADLVAVLGPLLGGGIGAGIVDILHGDLDFPMLHQMQEQAKGAWGRLRSGESGRTTGVDTMTWSESQREKKQTKIESQTNEYNFDFSGLTGNIETPEDLQRAANIFADSVAENQERVNI